MIYFVTNRISWTYTINVCDIIIMWVLMCLGGIQNEK